MIVSEFKCGMCGHRFEVEVLDRQDPREKNVPGSPVRCPKCHNGVVERVRDLRRVTRRAS